MPKNACTDVGTFACRFQRSNIYCRISKNPAGYTKRTQTENLRLVF